MGARGSAVSPKVFFGLLNNFKSQSCFATLTMSNETTRPVCQVFYAAISVLA